MIRQELLTYCSDTYGTALDYAYKESITFAFASPVTGLISLFGL